MTDVPAPTIPAHPAKSPLHGFFRATADRPAFSTIMLFLMPALLVYLAFTAYPVLRTFYNSLHILHPRADNEFVGLANYIEMMTADPTFWVSVKNTMIWAVIAPLLDVGLGLTLAICLYAKAPFARFFRVAWFTPVLISYVVVGILWMWIYNYDWGILNGLLRAVGLEDWARAWLGDTQTALWAVMVTHTWKWAGFNMVVCLAALSALPKEVLEASELDHCNWVQKAWFIMIPMIRPTLINLLILSLIGKMKVFDLVWIMTQGGPLWATETVSTYVYKRAFQWSTFDLGYPSAIAVFWFFVVLVSVMALKFAFRQRDKLEY